MKSYDPEFKKRLIERFKEAMASDFTSIRDFAEGYGIPHSVFSEWLQAAGIRVRKTKMRG